MSAAGQPDCRARLVRELERISVDGLVTIRVMQRDPIMADGQAAGGESLRPALKLPAVAGGPLGSLADRVSVPPVSGKPLAGPCVELSDATMMLLQLVALHDDRTPADWIAAAVCARAEAVGLGMLADEIERHAGDLAGCDVARHADSNRANPARGKR